MVEIANAASAGVARPIQFFHMPVPKGRTDDAYFTPLDTPQSSTLPLLERPQRGKSSRFAVEQWHVTPLTVAPVQ